MAKLEPPPKAVLEQLERMSEALLDSLAYDKIYPFFDDHTSFKPGDDIIFRVTGGVGPNDTLYGTVTGRGRGNDDEEIYIVVPVSHTHHKRPQDYALLLIPTSMIVQPEYDEGQGIPLGQVTEWLAARLTLLIQEREVMVNADGLHVYRYRFRLELSNEQDGLEEDDVQALVAVATSIGKTSLPGNR